MSTQATSPSPFGLQLFRHYEMGRRMLAALAEDFTDEEARTPEGTNKSLVWYLGHLAVTENYLLMLYTGDESALSDEHNRRFGRGSDGFADFGDVSKQEMLDLLAGLRSRMKRFVFSLAPEDMEREPLTPVAHEAFGKLGTAYALVTAHLAYHGGQIAQLRRAKGKDALFG